MQRACKGAMRYSKGYALLYGRTPKMPVPPVKNQQALTQGCPINFVGLGSGSFINKSEAACPEPLLPIDASVEGCYPFCCHLQ